MGQVEKQLHHPNYLLWWDPVEKEYVAKAIVQGRFNNPVGKAGIISGADPKPGKALKLLRKTLRKEGLL